MPGVRLVAAMVAFAQERKAAERRKEEKKSAKERKKAFSGRPNLVLDIVSTVLALPCFGHAFPGGPESGVRVQGNFLGLRESCSRFNP